MNRPSDGSALEVWGELPLDLQQALTEAMEGLSDAFGDLSHPLSPQLRQMWDVADRIEAYVLAREQESFGPRE